MKHQKPKSIKLLLALVLFIGLNQSVLSQYLTGQMTIGDPVSLINGDLTIASTGEMFLGQHSPHGRQTNMLSITGNYTGEAGSQVYLSVIDNSNMQNTRGYIDIVGTATKTDGPTTIVLDMFEGSPGVGLGSGWNGACIDIIRANSVGSDPGTFRMDTMQLNNHRAVLRNRIYANDIVWYIAEKLILSQQTAAQTTCSVGEAFNPLSVVTAASGNYSYQWYSCDADGTNFINLGAENGAQTANYTPPSTEEGDKYYRCVVTSIICNYNMDTTAISGAISVGSAVRILTQPVKQIAQKGDRVVLNVVAEGMDLTYQWYKNGVAMDNENSDQLNIILDIDGVNEYYVKITDACGAVVVSDKVTAGTATDDCLPIIDQKRNHTLVVNNNPEAVIDGGNGGYEFVYYTWYKNGELLKSDAGGKPGSFQKGGYYYTGGGNLNPKDAYYVVMRDVNNREYTTCVFYPKIKILANVSAYPIPLGSLANYTITVDAEVSDPEMLAGATIDVYNSAGMFLGRKAVQGQYTQVSLPNVAGVYVLVFKSSEINKEIKVIVE